MPKLLVNREHNIKSSRVKITINNNNNTVENNAMMMLRKTIDLMTNIILTKSYDWSQE